MGTFLIGTGRFGFGDTAYRCIFLGHHRLHCRGQLLTGGPAITADCGLLTDSGSNACVPLTFPFPFVSVTHLSGEADHTALFVAVNPFVRFFSRSFRVGRGRRFGFYPVASVASDVGHQRGGGNITRVLGDARGKLRFARPARHESNVKHVWRTC